MQFFFMVVAILGACNEKTSFYPKSESRLGLVLWTHVRYTAVIIVIASAFIFVDRRMSALSDSMLETIRMGEEMLSKRDKP